MTRPTQAIIYSSALRANVQRIRELAPQQKVIAVLKADGYGHGAVRVANVLATLVDAFAVCSLDEALVLRHAGITTPILLLEGFFSVDELPIIAAQQLETVVHTQWQIEHILASQLPVKVWLKVDTGMHRLGFLPEETEAIWKRLNQCDTLLKPVPLMSHLSCADERQNKTTIEQLSVFNELLRRISTEASFANSAGILAWQATHCDWVRPGIMLYGVSPFPDTVAKDEGLQSVMQLQSALISVKQYRKGDSIGYGATWRCPQSMPVGVVAVGYADGYPRHAPSGTPVLVNGRRVPLIGRVSMDMLAVDLRSQPNAKVGDVVVLWGRNLPIEEIATLAGTIPYQLLCNVSQRVPRIERT
ncbi:alanine racemase [Beggiatoa leptomitoformis]|uniref:Alanine racemase n=1 Tax=Beggiatoa leptomitoformis TaxID=288004 RepID=A0A2N9YB70_9GAMM|nr:alanine racemase [Beggiatoa leptomitoformis]ALG66924.1 alanine racemase [Beggiatoa leptomitoformis]AUI67710.1 alanine racemase [Beggiatoa leptomitoformis]